MKHSLLPVKIHYNIENKQYAIACHLPSHPGGKNFKPARTMKRIISTEHKEMTDRLIGTINLERTYYKIIIKKTIHSHPTHLLKY